MPTRPRCRQPPPKRNRGGMLREQNPARNKARPDIFRPLIRQHDKKGGVQCADRRSRHDGNAVRNPRFGEIFPHPKMIRSVPASARKDKSKFPFHAHSIA